MKKILPLALLAASAVTSQAVVLDWDKIEHWVGEGRYRAALVIQFNDGGPREAYVWGYRWDDGQYEDNRLTGEQLFRAIVAGSDDLLLMTQYTGGMGSTVNGIGYFDPKNESPLVDKISFDFDNAKDDERISFDYYSPNELMGQTKAPGAMTPMLCARAIADARDTRVIEHPVNALEYGYPAYDYDWWQPSAELDRDTERWQAGWYDGYWSYWVGGADLYDMSYSGLGFSSRTLGNDGVDGWMFSFLDGPVTDWGILPDLTGEWCELNYSHFNPSSAELTVTGHGDAHYDVYTVSGVRVASDSLDGLARGVYIIRYADGRSVKTAIK